MTATHPSDNRHHFHRPSSSTNHADCFHHRHRPSTSRVPSHINGLEHRTRSPKSHLSIAVGLSSPPLIQPVRHSNPAAPINHGLPKVHSPHPLHTEHSYSPSTKTHEPCYQFDRSNQSDDMAPKLTRAMAKAKEFQTQETPLVQRLNRIKNAKVQEGPFQKLSTEIQEWSFEDRRMTEATAKV